MAGSVPTQPSLASATRSGLRGTGTYVALTPHARRIGLIRLLLLAIALAIVVFFQQREAELIPEVIRRLRFGLVGVAGIAFLLIVTVQQVRARWQLALHLVLDLLWIGLLIFYTGGVASMAVVLLYAVVLIGNLELPGVAPFSMPALAALVLAGNAALYLAGCSPFSTDYLAHAPGMIDSSRVLGFLGVQVAALFLVDLLGQLLAARLREHRLFTGTVLDQLAEGVLAVDLHQVVVYANAELVDLLGLTMQPQGRPVAKVLAHLPEVLRLVHGRGQDERSDLILNRYLVLRVQDIRSRKGHPIGRTLVAVDETRLRILEDNARRAEQLAQLGGMAAGIAHEVRNPLTSLRGCAQELADICVRFGHGDAASLARIMVDESDRLARIVGDFLALSRLREPQRRMVAVAPVLAELDALSRRRQDLPHGLTLELVTETACHDVYADPDQLRQVLSNLINNAIDAVINATAPRVRCVARCAAEPNALAVPAVEFIVSDNGCGIPPELHERVFTPFFSTKAQGTGLGLSLVSRMVRQHDGVLHLESPEGGGTVVRLLLPAQVQSRAYTRLGAPTTSLALSEVTRP